MNNDRKDNRNSDFSTVESVMSSVMQNSNLRQGIKKASVFKFWAKAAGKKFEKYSRAEGINANNVLTVACANASVSSELTMFKADLIKKINQYSMPLGIEIEDIHFSHKIWKKPSLESENPNVNPEPPNPYKRDLTGFNPDEIELDSDDVEAIRNSVSNNKFASPEQREKMFNAIILDLKVQKFVKQKPKN